MRKIRIWLRANLFNWPYWRVTYGDGDITRPLKKHEARGLSECFGGEVWIDYTIKYDI